MCRNITPLRGLEPPATAAEVESAARQYVRKVAAAPTAAVMASAAFERAVERVAAATAELLAELPPRRTPPVVVPPLRRAGQPLTPTSRTELDAVAVRALRLGDQR
ncbi:MAG: DUF2277 family protein [Acidimicrobiales bacterium]